MPVNVRDIQSPSDIPEGATYVLVMYGPENKDTRHSRGVTMMITAPEDEPDDIKRLKLVTAVDGAKRLADKEGIPTVYVMGAPSDWRR